MKTFLKLDSAYHVKGEMSQYQIIKMTYLASLNIFIMYSNHSQVNFFYQRTENQ